MRLINGKDFSPTPSIELRTRTKVFCSFWDFVAEEGEYNTSNGFAADCYIKKCNRALADGRGFGRHVEIGFKFDQRVRRRVYLLNRDFH
jgi:hypothetical protein